MSQRSRAHYQCNGECNVTGELVTPLQIQDTKWTSGKNYAEGLLFDRFN